MLPKESCDKNAASMPLPPDPELHTTETESPVSYDSDALLKGRREVVIHHHGEVYRLRLTRNDKLILNK